MFTPPDWRIATNYPDMKRGKVSPSVWAWEFLRRNVEYQSDYRATFLKRRKRWLPNDLKVAFAGRWGFAVNSDGTPHVASPDEASSFDDATGQFYPPVAFAPQLPSFIFDSADGRSVVCPADATLRAGETAHVMWVKIDLRIALNRQIDAIRGLADRAQWLRGNSVVSATGSAKRLESRDEPLHIKLHQNKFSIYLRVLDAEAAGSKAKEIVEVLSPGRHGATANWKRDSLIAARRFRDSDWRLILQLPPLGAPIREGSS
ncbi:MAG: DUF6499 domain-containing protein [Magnetospirillum sp.]|nr:DUF6499 domain-containing protein [Magnetospirillum sp.]